jgi:hypothetical protein
VDPDAVQSMIFCIPQEAGAEVPANFRNCRTIWWKVPDVTDMPKGDYVESGCISAQGISGIYFRFYPKGKANTRPGFCSLYVGSHGTECDVTVRLRLGTTKRILTQRLHPAFVDGVLNFCDLSQTGSDSLVIGLDIMRGPEDDLAPMTVTSAPLWAEWTIPNMTEEHMNTLSKCDRFTSDILNVDGLGQDAAFVLYPKGDDADAISGLGQFVNVGLFGSSHRDVTFRMSAGGVSKVLTACSDRYRAKFTGRVKASGEFFDPCFAKLEDMVDAEKDEIRINLEVLDTTAKHHLSGGSESVEWHLEDIAHLRQQMQSGEFMTSRFVNMPGVKDGYLSLGIAFHEHAVEFSLTRVAKEGKIAPSRGDFVALRPEQQRMTSRRRSRPVAPPAAQHAAFASGCNRSIGA